MGAVVLEISDFFHRPPVTLPRNQGCASGCKTRLEGRPQGGLQGGLQDGIEGHWGFRALGSTGAMEEIQPMGLIRGWDH
jgi:hypothetical protein